MRIRKKLRFIGYYDYTVLLTCLSMISAIVGIVAVFNGRKVEPMFCIAFCGLCDGFDGRVAHTKKNRSRQEKIFGAELDSLCDMFCFGLFPAILYYYYGLRSIFGIALIVLYCLCALQRLAFFNMMEITQDADRTPGFFRGMPVTAVTIFLPLAFMLRCLLPELVFTVMLHLFVAILSLLYIVDIPVKKFTPKKIIIVGSVVFLALIVTLFLEY